MSGPDESVSSVLSFLHAFTVRTLVLMSGAASVPVALAALFVPIPILRVIFGGLALGCGCYAAYAVWKQERQEVGRLRVQLARRKTASELKRGLDALIADGTKVSEDLADFRAKARAAAEQEDRTELVRHFRAMADWSTKAQGWLEEHMPEYAAEFDMPSPRKDPSLETWVYDRIKRLRDLKREIDE